MDVTKLMAIVGVILALSIASERLVEIIKGLWPWLNTKNKTDSHEGYRRSLLHIFSVLSGILTAFLAKDYIPLELAGPTKSWAIVGLGLLASGGSGFWNSVLTYLANVKEIKKAEAAKIK